MFKKILSPIERLFEYVDVIFNKAFTNKWNPFYHLGGLTIFFLWVVLVSGVYVFIFFETSIFGAYESVEYMTNEQWYLAGIMRSLHRYASDAAVLTMMLHLFREFIKDHHRGTRWFSWFTGIPLIWMIFPLGITGYWLVWDELAQYIAIASSELLDWLPIFTDPMARNFLVPESLSDRFFTLMAFLHLIGIPIFLVIGIWIHLLRISSPKVNPPMRLMLGSMAALLVLSLVKPAISHQQADLSIVPMGLNFDWFYLFAYTLQDMGSAGLLWLVLIGSSVFLSILPWLPRLKVKPAAQVNLPSCNGCGRCDTDCPFGAITMQPRTDDLKYDEEAVVDPDICTACGICVGACPTATPYRRKTALVPGIDLPEHTMADVRDELHKACEGLSGKQRVVVFGCDSGTHAEQLAMQGAAVLTLPCIAMLPPSFIDYVLSRQLADGVLLTGCHEGDCHYRVGVEWMNQRLAGKRDPYLRSRVPIERVDTFWQGNCQTESIKDRVERFQLKLQEINASQARHENEK